MTPGAQILTKSVDGSLSWAAEFARDLRPGDCVALQGDLGAGKTVLSQGICRALGYTGPVKSPTYALVHEYPNTPPLFHLDLYRLAEGARLDDLADVDRLAEGITLIEWPERLAQDAGVEFTHTVRIQKRDEQEREIVFF
jgi:tRNA threonylcarbamoyladenosine biosynthesis protein TsaE